MSSESSTSSASAKYDQALSRERFNLSMWALRNRTVVGYFLLVIAVAGVLAYGRLGQAEDPPFIFKIMVVRAYWPGASALEVESQLTDKLEKKLQEMPWLDHLQSYSRSGESTILFYALDETPAAAVSDVFYQVRKKIGDIRHTLPLGVQGPFFNDEFGDVFGNVYALTGENLSYPQLKDLAEDLRDELLRVPQVAKVKIFGVQEEQIVVELSNARLATLGLPLSVVQSALIGQNNVVSSGFFETASERLQVRLSGALSSEQAVADTLIRYHDRVLRVGDIAKVYRAVSDPPDVRVRYADGSAKVRAALTLGVTMREGGDNIELGRDLTRRVGQLRSQLPLGVALDEVVSQPEAVEASVKSFVGALLEAVSVVLLVSFLSLGLRTGTVVVVSIPLVLAATFLGMWLFDIGLHIVSLGALILALGLLVDDATIAVEMMSVKMESGWDRLRAASFAYTSTAFPMLSGTLVTVAGFIPIAIAQSKVGEYAGSFFSVNAIALILSWFAAVIAIPWFGFYLLPERTAVVTEKSNLHDPTSAPGSKDDKRPVGTAPERDIYDTPFYRRFRRVVAWCLRRRGLVIASTMGLFVLSLWALQFVPQQFFPESNRLELSVELRLPEGASLAASAAEVERFSEWLAKDQDEFHDFSHYVVYIGTGVPRFCLVFDEQLASSNLSQFLIHAKNPEARDRLKRRIVAYNNSGLSPARINVMRIENGPPVGYPVQYRVSGRDIKVLRQAAEQVAAGLRQDPDVNNVHFDWYEWSKVVHLQVDQDKARLLGVSTQELADFLHMQLLGSAVTQVREGEKLLSVLLRGDADNRHDLAALLNLNLPTASGKTVSLAQLATASVKFEPGIIWRRDRLPTMTVRAAVKDGVLPATVVAAQENAIEAIRAQLPIGYRLEVGGSVEESDKGRHSVMSGVPLVLFVVITLLMLQLKNVSHVLMVLASAPLGMIGVVLFLLVTSKPFGFMALLGVVALFGMIMRNAVILIDQIDQDLRQGRSQYDAIVGSAVRRARPIALTALTAVLAMIPLSRNEFFGPMAVSIMGGLIIATLLTLIFLPALYAAWYRVPAPAADESAASCCCPERGRP